MLVRRFVFQPLESTLLSTILVIVASTAAELMAPGFGVEVSPMDGTSPNPDDVARSAMYARLTLARTGDAASLLQRALCNWLMFPALLLLYVVEDKVWGMWGGSTQLFCDATRACVCV